MSREGKRKKEGEKKIGNKPIKFARFDAKKIYLRGDEIFRRWEKEYEAYLYGTRQEKPFEQWLDELN